MAASVSDRVDSEYSDGEDGDICFTGPAPNFDLGGSSYPEFSITLPEFNSFRAVTECLKTLNASDPLVFIIDNNNVHIQHINRSGKAKVMIDARLYRRKILEYISPSEPTLLSLSPVDLYSVVKSIPRKDGLKIIKYRDSHEIYFNLMSQVSGRTGSNVLRIQDTSVASIHELPTYGLNGKGEPRHKFLATEYAKFCSTICSLKCHNMSIKLYPRGTIFSGNTKTGSIMKVMTMGEIPLEGTPEFSECAFANIPIETARSWGKLHGITGSIASGAIINFYFEPGKPIMMELDIGHYGTMSIVVCE
jgi:hypothetical protein